MEPLTHAVLSSSSLSVKVRRTGWRRGWTRKVEDKDEEITASSAGEEHRGLKISGDFCRSGFHADFPWQLYMLTTTSRDADTNPS